MVSYSIIINLLYNVTVSVVTRNNNSFVSIYYFITVSHAVAALVSYSVISYNFSRRVTSIDFVSCFLFSSVSAVRYSTLVSYPIPPFIQFH